MEGLSGMNWQLSLTAVLASYIGAAEPLAVRLTPIPTETTAWRVALADLNADGVDEALYAGYDGELYCLDRTTGKTLWRADLGGFPYCLRTADLNADGRPEVLAMSASLYLFAFSPDGQLLWKFSSGAPLHAVAAGPMLGEGVPQVVCGGEDMTLHFLDAGGNKIKELPVEVAPNIEAIKDLAIGDITGDAANELCLTNGFGIVRVLDPRTGATIWNSRDYGRRFMRDLMLWDADGDGKQEVLASSERIELLDGDGTLLWQQAPGVGKGRGYRMPLLAPIDLDGDERQEVAVLYGPELSVLDGSGARVYHQQCDFYYFTAVGGHSPATNEVVIGSVTGADRNLYALEFDGPGRDEFAAFTHNHGYINTLNDNLARIREQVLAARPAPDTPDRIYRVWISGGSPPPNQLGWVLRQNQAFRAAYPYDNIIFQAFLQYREPGRRGQGNEFSVADLMKIARTLEEGDVAHALGVAHGLDPYMSIETLEKWLQTAPNTCAGFLMSENSHPVTHRADADQSLLDRIDAFIDGFMLPVMDLCLAHRKKVYLLEKQLWWVGLPAAAKYAPRILAEKYRPVIVPMVEESNSRCPELNFTGRVGLWRAGIVREWGLNVIDDQLRTCKLYEYTPCEAHPSLRHYVAYAAAGARELKLGKLMYLFTAPKDEERYDMSVGDINYRPYGLLAFDTFMHLLGKGLLVAPTPEELVGASPVAVRFHEPHEGFWLSARMRDPDRVADASRDGLFTGFDWGYTRPHPYYAPAYLMNVPRYCHQFIPENPYGLPLIVPHWAAPEQMQWAAEMLDTDGVHVLEDGRTRSARQAKADILEAFQQAARTLPFTASNVYWMGRRTGDDSYRVVLVDPGYLMPSGRQVVLTVNAPGQLAAARDVLSGERLTQDGHALRIKVPAGAFRIIDLKLQR